MFLYIFLVWELPVQSKFHPLRVPLRRVPSIRAQLRTQGLLEEFLKDHRPDMFNRRYAQCFPPGTPSLRLRRSSEKIYNFMDVSEETAQSFYVTDQNKEIFLQLKTGTAKVNPVLLNSTNESFSRRYNGLVKVQD